MSIFVLVHGAYQGGWIWEPVAGHLRQCGHTVYMPTLDGCAERAHTLRHGITTETQAREVAEFLHFHDLMDVVIVGASLGGMIACKLGELARARIRSLIFVDAVALQDGEKLSDFVVRPPGQSTPFAAGPSPAEAHMRLFGDVEEPLRSWAAERTTMHPIGVLEAPVSLPSFWTQSWSAAVIYCPKSFNPPRAAQERTAEILKAKWMELDTGHYPMLTRPGPLADLLMKAS